MSQVAIPLVSWSAIERMVDLKADSAVDNMLVEWTLALELVDLGKLARIFPIFLGTINKDGQQMTKIWDDMAPHLAPTAKEMQRVAMSTPKVHLCFHLHTISVTHVTFGWQVVVSSVISRVQTALKTAVSVFSPTVTVDTIDLL